MAFIRKKKVSGHTYYQLVKSYRQNGKVRQKIIVHLGKHPTLVEALIDAFGVWLGDDSRGRWWTKKRIYALLDAAKETGNLDSVHELIRFAKDQEDPPRYASNLQLLQSLKWFRENWAWTDEDKREAAMKAERKRLMTAFKSKRDQDHASIHDTIFGRLSYKPKSPGDDIQALRRFKDVTLSEIIWALEYFSEQDRTAILNSVAYICCQVGERLDPFYHEIWSAYHPARMGKPRYKGRDKWYQAQWKKTVSRKGIDAPDILGMKDPLAAINRVLGPNNTPVANLLADFVWGRLSPEAIIHICELLVGIAQVAAGEKELESYALAVVPSE